MVQHFLTFLSRHFVGSHAKFPPNFSAKCSDIPSKKSPMSFCRRAGRKKIGRHLCRTKLPESFCDLKNSRTGRRRVSKRGARRGFPIWTCPSLFVIFCPFLSLLGLPRFFPGSFRFLQGFSRLILFLFLGLSIKASRRNGPERVCDTIQTFPDKSGKLPSLETFSQHYLVR